MASGWESDASDWVETGSWVYVWFGGSFVSRFVRLAGVLVEEGAMVQYMLTASIADIMIQHRKRQEKMMVEIKRLVLLSQGGPEVRK